MDFWIEGVGGREQLYRLRDLFPMGWNRWRYMELDLDLWIASRIHGGIDLRTDFISFRIDAPPFS